MKFNIQLLLLICMTISIASSCKTKSSVNSTQDAVVESIDDINGPSEHMNPNNGATPHSNESDCHGVRKTIMVLNNKEAEIINVAGQYLISIPPGTKRYNPCELPEKAKVENLKVVFSGEVLEIFQNERLAGTPFRLTTLDIIKD